MSTYESYAEYYHDLTKYSPEGIASNQHRLDFDKQPSVFKEYPSQKKIDISYLLLLDRNPFSDVGIKPQKDFTNEEKYLAKLSTLLYFSYGITAIVPHAEKPFYMRSSPSAGGLYPSEIYVISEDYPGLEDGIYNFQVVNQSLAQIKKGKFKSGLLKATFDNPNINEAKLTLVLTGVFYRSSWRYQDRAYRRICLDTGHILGNIDVVSSACGFKAVLAGGFNDKSINEILELDEEEEQSLVVLPLIDKNNTVKDFPKALPSKLDKVNIKTPEGNRLIELHNRSNIEKFVNIPNIKIQSVEEKLSFCTKAQFDENKISFNWNKNLYTTLLKRRSTRAFSGESISKEELAALLDFGYHPELFRNETLDPNPDYFDASLIETFIAVNDVDGLEEGCYFYSKDGRYLRQIRFKNFREEIHYLCLGQELGYKASAVIFHTADLSKAVFKYGERAYRYLHLDAGHLGQRINLAAANLNIGVSGIGGFFDDQVNEMLGIPEHEAVVYITTLGVPAKNS
jgi:SagB-type dehydrogenase family enzyme